jgi:hypothetical protein
VEILKTLESLYATAHPEAKEAAEADVAQVEQEEDWTSITKLPEWKQRRLFAALRRATGMAYVYVQTQHPREVRR